MSALDPRSGPVASISRICFRYEPGDAQAGVLFVADWVGSQVHAFDLEPATQSRPVPSVPENPPRPFPSVMDLQAALPPQFHQGDLELGDIAVRIGTDEVWAGVTVVSNDARIPLILRWSPGDIVDIVDLSRTPSQSTAITEAIEPDLELWPDIHARTFTVTALNYHKDKLYVAGVGNTHFRSTLRVYPYPFGAAPENVPVEIYHTGHRGMESRAPVRSMTFMELSRDGNPDHKETHIAAGYLCTPMALFRLKDIEAYANSDDPATEKAVEGKVIAEFGAGGIPFGIFPYVGQKGISDTSTEQRILVGLELRQSLTLPMSTIERAALDSTPTYARLPTDMKQDIEVSAGRSVIGFADEQEAGFVDVQINYVLRADIHPGADHIVALRRNLRTGKAELVGVATMTMLRMGDWHPREFDFYIGDADGPTDPRSWVSKTPFDAWETQVYNMFKLREGAAAPTFQQHIDPNLMPPPLGV